MKLRCSWMYGWICIIGNVGSGVLIVLQVHQFHRSAIIDHGFPHFSPLAWKFKVIKVSLKFPFYDYSDINDIVLMFTFLSWIIYLCVISFQRSKLYPAYSLNVSSLYLKLGRLYMGLERGSVGTSELKKVTGPAKHLHHILNYNSYKVPSTKWTTVNTALTKSRTKQTRIIRFWYRLKLQYQYQNHFNSTSLREE